MASQTREIKEISFGRTKVIVDGFAFPNPFVRHYFLTHCHSDHTIGLKKSFSQGVIYCSEAAGNLLRHDFRLQNPQLIRPLKLHETVAVVEGLRVTAMSANHSPDAVMFLFDYVECGVERRIVHTGDFRFSPDMLTAGNGLLLAKPIERLYLDTTYLNPRYAFPTQEKVIVEVANWMRQQLLAEPKTYFAFMSYHIGKERAFFGVAEFLNLKVYVTPSKLRVLELLNLPERWMRMVVKDPRAACIGVGGRVNEDVVAEDVKKLGFRRGVIIRPTGWSFGKSTKSLVSSRVSAHNIIIASAPYSEHSSYDEIRECVKSLKPKKVIPTVNAETSGQRNKLVEKELIGFLDLKEDKRRIDAYFKVNHGNRSLGGRTGGIGEKREKGASAEVHAAVFGTSKAIDLTASPAKADEPHASKIFNIDDVDVDEQRRILKQLEAAGRKRSSEPGTLSAPKKLSAFEKFFKPKK